MTHNKWISFQTAKRLQKKGLNGEAEWNYVAVADEIVLGKALKGAGSLLEFAVYGQSRELAIDGRLADIYPAYDRDELYALLPDRIDSRHGVLKLNYRQHTGLWVYWYQDAVGERSMEAYDVSEVETIAKLMITLLDTGISNAEMR